jgi:hypothetical protein
VQGWVEYNAYSRQDPSFDIIIVRNFEQNSDSAGSRIFYIIHSSISSRALSALINLTILGPGRDQYVRILYIVFY